MEKKRFVFDSIEKSLEDLDLDLNIDNEELDLSLEDINISEEEINIEDLDLDTNLEELNINIENTIANLYKDLETPLEDTLLDALGIPKKQV